MVERSYEFSRTGNKLDGLDLFQMKGDLIYDLILDNKGVDIAIGHSMLVKDGVIVGSTGANPCLIALLILNKGMYVIHSTGSSFTSEQMNLIEQANEGLAGGVGKIINDFTPFLAKHNIRIELPTNEESVFNIAVVRKKILTAPKGIFFGYNQPQ